MSLKASRGTAPDAPSKAGASDDAQEVVRLYESYPYPAHGIVSSVIAELARATVQQLRVGARGRSIQGLDAGCGTGEQTLGMVRAFPDLAMTGIDFSEASLAFARRLAERTALHARFLHRDLSRKLEGLGAYDLILCVGTLHHLPDPEEGLRRLRPLAREGGMLLGMVYGTFGKFPLFRVRDALSLLVGSDASREDKLAILASSGLANNLGPSEYLRTLSARRRFGPRIPWREALTRVIAGRSKAYQADAYTHPQELSYTWAELDAMLLRTGWRWYGWPEKSGMPDDPGDLLDGQALGLLREKGRLEQASIYERILCPPNLYFLASPV